ncbi:MAG TPA: DUF1614 domain-containing protein [Methanocella sp.]|nr:DUF1614 domain-containing protein [Methanocella sp.]
MTEKNLPFLPFSLPFFILLLVLPFMVLAVLALLEISPGSAVQQALGLSVIQAVALYLTVLLASIFNVPVYEFKSGRDSEQKHVSYMGQEYALPVWHGHRTTISLNLGGCIVATIVAVYFAIVLPPIPVILSTIVVSLSIFLLSRPSRSIGFYVSLYVPPAISIVVALITLYVYGLGLVNVARLSFIAGTVGTIVGTTLLNLPRLRKTGTIFISIGGLGCFDGIILTGVLSTLLACVIAALHL